MPDQPGSKELDQPVRLKVGMAALASAMAAKSGVISLRESHDLAVLVLGAPDCGADLTGAVHRFLVDVANGPQAAGDTLLYFVRHLVPPDPAVPLFGERADHG